MIENRVSNMIGARKMTIAEVAHLRGLSYNAVANIYYGKTKSIDFETLNKLCFALDCTTNDIFTYIPD